MPESFDPPPSNLTQEEKNRLTKLRSRSRIGLDSDPFQELLEPNEQTAEALKLAYTCYPLSTLNRLREFLSVLQVKQYEPKESDTTPVGSDTAEVTQYECHGTEYTLSRKVNQTHEYVVLRPGSLESDAGSALVVDTNQKITTILPDMTQLLPHTATLLVRLTLAAGRLVKAQNSATNP